MSDNRPTRQNPEARIILEQCVERLRKYLIIASMQAHDHLFLDRGIDAELVIGADAGQRRLLVEIKQHLSSVSIAHFLNQLALRGIDKKDLLVCTNYANHSVIEQLETAGINFVDTFGNMGIEFNNPRTIIHIKGNKGVAGAKPAAQRSRLMQPSGLKVLFMILTQPDAINLPYRDIAAKSGVSLGSVGWIVRELKSQGNVLEKKSGALELTNRIELFRRWVEAYSEQLRPKIVLRTLVAPRLDTEEMVANLDKIATNNQMMWALTGKVAADAFTHHLIPNKLTFFAKHWTQDCERELRWAPSERGNIVVLDMFSSSILYQNKLLNYQYPLAHPALVYAELLSEGTDRERETAAILAKDYLLDLVI
ncbi:MAG: type IV toxin-antitoxin system AbiEi family antitoxin [Candidatus Aquicultor sp.]|nr:type IV toxin-antitoxin system AbiEi family antitoxin [Candidatus Aquicultor sp.]